MRTIIVGHCDGAQSMIEYFRRAFTLAVGPGVQVVFRLDPPGNPDILIYSVFGQRHQKYNCKKILLCGEPSDVSRLRADVVFDCKNVARLRPSGAHFHYLPFYMLSFVERFKNRVQDLIKPATFSPDRVLSTKTKFCAFLYSQNVDFRNSLFDVISRYRPVDALGKCRGPPGRAVDRRVYEVGKQTYNDLAVAKYRPYKFVICCENSRHPGYVTEKMLSAMLANAIPIYLGAPDVAEHFNPASFINVGAFPNWEHAVAKIKELDQNPAKYKAMLAQPWLKQNTLSHYFDPAYAVSAVRAILAKPALAPTIVRNRVGPRITSVAARNLRHVAHARVGTLVAARRPAPRIAGRVAVRPATTRLVPRTAVARVAVAAAVRPRRPIAVRVRPAGVSRPKIVVRPRRA